LTCDLKELIAAINAIRKPYFPQLVITGLCCW